MVYGQNCFSRLDRLHKQGEGAAERAAGNCYDRVRPAIGGLVFIGYEDRQLRSVLPREKN